MIKVVLVMPSFRGGGAERVFIDLADGLRQDGFDVVLLALSGEGSYASSIPEGLRVRVLGGGSVKGNFFQLIRYFNQARPDVALSCLTHLNIVVAVARSFSRAKPKLILTEHNPFSSEKSAMHPVMKWLFRFFAQRTYPLAERVVVVSRGIKSDLEENIAINSKLVDVIYNPINIDRVQALAKDKGCKDDEDSDDGHWPKLVTMGRLVPQKRFDVLIRAFAKVKMQMPAARLQIIGSGPDHEELLGLASALNLERSVIFEGFMDNPFPQLNGSDLFVLSSDFEGFGNVIVEALALGKIVVSTDCPTGPGEILEHGKYGYLVPMGSPDLLADKIVSALQHGCITPDVLRDRARRFDCSVALEQYKTLIDSLV